MVNSELSTRIESRLDDQYNLGHLTIDMMTIDMGYYHINEVRIIIRNKPENVKNLRTY